MEIKEPKYINKKLKQEKMLFFAEEFVYDFEKETKANLVDKFEIVQDYISQTKVRKDFKTSYGGYSEPVEETRGQHELLAEEMGKLVNKIREGNYDNLVFLDKSGRPLVTMLRDMWPYHYDSKGNMVDTKQYPDKLPKINFLNIGRETQRFLENYSRNNFDAIYNIVKQEHEKHYDPKKLRDYEYESDEYQLNEVFKDMEKIKGEKYKSFNHGGPETYSRFISLIIKSPEIMEKIKGLTDIHPLFKEGGRILVIDECSISGNSKEIARRIIEAGLNLKNQTGQVDICDLTNDHDEYTSLFKDSNGFGRIPPWRNPDLEGVTGVVDSLDDKFISQAYYKKNPDGGEQVKQLRNELHTIAFNYLQSQKKKLENKHIGKDNIAA